MYPNGVWLCKAALSTGAAIAVFLYQLPSAAYLHCSDGIMTRQPCIALLMRPKRAGHCLLHIGYHQDSTICLIRLCQNRHWQDASRRSEAQKSKSSREQISPRFLYTSLNSWYGKSEHTGVIKQCHKQGMQNAKLIVWRSLVAVLTDWGSVIENGCRHSSVG